MRQFFKVGRPLPKSSYQRARAPYDVTEGPEMETVSCGPAKCLRCNGAAEYVHPEDGYGVCLLHAMQGQEIRWKMINP